MGRLYRIGEVAELLELKSYVLRFWESEFPQLAPMRTDKGQRLYSEDHIELLKKIKQLLHQQGMTIDGARRLLEEGNIENDEIEEQTQKGSEFKDMLIVELTEIRKLLTKETK
ncbi:MAG: MerR family transcriptional regulator [Desulfovibrio sp.]|nr:MerR family transcriptional regulator [Desulfovibrio sp.]